jgi:hypothetical protein
MDDLVWLAFGVIGGALFVLIVQWLRHPPDPVAPRPRTASPDPKGPICRWCDYPMDRHGYVAHGFQRLYVCPLCRSDTFVVDPDLKRQKIARVEAQRREGEAAGA